MLGWVKGIELTAEQQQRLDQKRHEASFAVNARHSAAAANKAARLVRIADAQEKAEAMLTTVRDTMQVNHIAAAMLYLGEGSKRSSDFRFANSNADIIRYWLYLLRSSFEINEAKFRLQLGVRADQDQAAVISYWQQVTGITAPPAVFVDPRTIGKSATFEHYHGVCSVHYHDTALRRYLDSVAHTLIARAAQGGQRLEQGAQ